MAIETKAEVAAEAVEVLADKHEVIEDFANALLTELSTRLREMSKRPSVDMVELLAVADELDAKRAVYAAKVKAV